MSNFNKGDIVKGQITGITLYGLFVSLEDDYTGLVHISEVSDKFISNLKKMFNIGDIINVKVLDIDENTSKVKLSIKKIDFKVEKNATAIVESGKGFSVLEEQLEGWIDLKMNEISVK